MNTRDFQLFLEDSYQYLILQQEICEELYHLSSYEYWHFSEDSDELSFSEGDFPALKTNCQAVGEWNSRTGIWKWSWSSPDLADALKTQMKNVRLLGISNGLDCLTMENWEATEADCWQMTAIAAKTIEASGAYRIPISDDRYLFTLLTKLEWEQRA